MQFDKAYDLLITELESNLPDYLAYHDVNHTKMVIASAALLAEYEGLNDEETTIVKTAALFHDAGYLKGRKNHEEASCLIAGNYLRSLDYSSDQIEKICKCIMATKIPQRPSETLEKILCDADLHYLGTKHYPAIAENLFHENKHYGTVKSRKEWMDKQVRFLSSHRFFTPSALKMYGEIKEANLNSIMLHAKQHSNKAAVLVSDIFLIISGVVIAGFALNGFMVPNHFFDGGVTGISLLSHELFHINLAYVVIALNVPFILAGYFTISKQFAIKTLLAIILLGVCLLLIPYPVITYDKLLISIFGGVFLGLGIGLVMRAGCALDGIEVVVLYTLKRTSFTITEIILGINIIIFSIAAFRFGVETALYSILTYYSASRMIDYVVEGIRAYTGVTIVSGESEMIKNNLVNELGRAITVYKGERGFLPGKYYERTDCDIIFTVVTRMELRKLKNVVYETDSKAFIFVNTIREASGGILNRRHLVGKAV